MQLKRLAKRIAHSSLLLSDLKKCCESCKLEPKKMIRSVETRWNSLTEVIGRALYLRPALERLVDLPHLNGTKTANLRKLKLSKDEWTILKQMHPLLKVCASISVSSKV